MEEALPDRVGVTVFHNGRLPQCHELELGWPGCCGDGLGAAAGLTARVLAKCSIDTEHTVYTAQPTQSDLV